MTLHELLDWKYGADGDDRLKRRLEAGEDPERSEGPLAETALHVAARRRRPDAMEILLDHGAEIDARTAGGKTAYAHAARRGFGEITAMLRDRGADTTLNDADRFAVAAVDGRLDDAREILRSTPGVARTGNPEEDRLLADVAGRNHGEPVSLLIAAGADLGAPGLDDGTPLHQAAWFGQPDNARMLIAAGAPLESFDRVHGLSPLGWVAHGSGYSGGAAERQERYIELARLLLKAGSALHYPDQPHDDAYLNCLLRFASPRVGEILRAAR